MHQEEIDMIELILQKHPDLNKQNCNGDTALMLACRNMRVKTVQLLLKYGADVNICNCFNETAFIYACQNYKTQVATFCQTDQNIEIMSLLLKQSTESINVQDNNGNTALIIASEKGYYDTVKLLLDYNANINIKNKDGNNALMMASRYGRNKTIQILLNHKDNINSSILQILLCRKHQQPVSTKFIKENLYVNEVNINQQNNEGNTALMIAINNKFFDTFKLLLTPEVNVNLFNREGNTLAILIPKELNLKWNEFGKCYLDLFKRGADFSIKNNKKKAAIYYAKNLYPEDAILGLVDYL
jgi:serine/threonine-protein phosphatase 6 regulatory ankyrin repeat subunit B